jgi:transcriptional regulator with XRE-family HTH domain
MPFGQIGPALAMWRGSRGLTQIQLATACGIGRAQLSRYEAGKEMPKLPSLEKILVELDVAPEHFFRSLVQLIEIENTPLLPGRPVRLEARKIAAAFDQVLAGLGELRQVIERCVEQRPGSET